MRYISVNSLKKNMVLAKTIYSSTGGIILPANVVLTDELISKIERAGILHLLIKDSRVDDIKIEEAVTYMTKFGLLKSLQGIFENLKKMRSIFSSPKDIKKSLLEGLINIEKIKNLCGKMIEETQEIGDLTNFTTTDKEIILIEVDNLENYLSIHSLNRTLLSLILGREMKLGVGELINLLVSALLCDIGMLFVPIEILHKKGKLSDEEFAYVKLHPEYTCEIIEANGNIPPQIINIVYQHHERRDGSGYPKKLKGEEIHPMAKIIAICDVYSALISKRPYRDAFLPHKAIEYIFASAGDLFDYKLVEKFCRNVPSYLKGVMVELNTGEVGCVVRQNKGFMARPVVRIFYDKEGREIKDLVEYDLASPEHQTKLVVKVLDV